jgi:hypothetical protein
MKLRSLVLLAILPLLMVGLLGCGGDEKGAIGSKASVQKGGLTAEQNKTLEQKVLPKAE